MVFIYCNGKNPGKDSLNGKPGKKDSEGIEVWQ